MKYIIYLLFISQSLSQVIERDNKLLWDGTDWKFISKRSASNPESIYRIKSAYINGLLDGRLYYYLKAWGENQGVGDKIFMIADPFLKFTKAIGAEVDKSEKGLGIRSNRYTMLVENEIIKKFEAEKETATCELSAAENFLKAI